MNICELMSLAYKIAQQSPDPSNQNGAVIIKTTSWDFLIFKAYNGFGRIPFDEEILNNREQKLAFIEHAERAVIYEAAARESLYGATMICPWACCTDCGRAIARVGIKRLVVHKPRMDTTPERWKQSVKDGLSCLRHYDVEIEYYSGELDLPKDFNIIVNGNEWFPSEVS